MPVKSKKQQRFMGMVQTGQLDDASPEVKKVAKTFINESYLFDKELPNQNIE